MSGISRRELLKTAAAGAIAAPAIDLFGGSAVAQNANTLTIAYNVVLPSWDPTVGLSAVNPTIQSIYKAVFDQYIDQNPDISLKPGLLTKWGWSDDKKQITMQLREGAFWHDGSPVTTADVIWSLERAGDPNSGNPIQFVWGKIGNFKAEGNTITADVKEFEPALFKWMAFLTGYVLPKTAYAALGAERFERMPIGSGPYMVEQFEANSFVRLKAFPKYWGKKPQFETVVFKFVTDPTSRVAEVETGASDVTLEMPYDEFDRLKKLPQLSGVATPVSDIGMIFLTNVEPMLDKNLRLALHHAIDKKALVDKLLRGYGAPIDTLEAPQYAAYDPTIKIGYDLAKAQQLMAATPYSAKNPCRFAIQTTRGFKPKDYECIEAVVGMWRKIGVEATIEVYEIAKHYELRAQHKLAPAAFYNWGNSIGDPSTSTGFAMFSQSPHSGWKTADVDALIGPLWGEPDEAKRIAGYKAVDRYIAEQGYVIPLFQYAQPIVYRKTLTVTPYVAGFLLPQAIGKA
jgi:peptide/nickel transport system substrate-binding protein